MVLLLMDVTNRADGKTAKCSVEIGGGRVPAVLVQVVNNVRLAVDAGQINSTNLPPAKRPTSALKLNETLQKLIHSRMSNALWQEKRIRWGSSPSMKRVRYGQLTLGTPNISAQPQGFVPRDAGLAGERVVAGGH